MGRRDKLRDKFRDIRIKGTSRKGKERDDRLQVVQPGSQTTSPRPYSDVLSLPTAEAVPDHALPGSPTASPFAVPEDSLWDRAYASLDPSVREAYEVVVEQETAKQEQTLSSEEREEIQQSVKAITAKGKEHRENRRLKFTVAKKTLVVSKMVAGVVRAITTVKPVIDEAVKASDAASIAWVGVSLVLPLLTRPSEADAKNLDDIAKITATMAYYTSIEDLLLSKRKGKSADMCKHAQNRVQDLYKAILNYLCCSSIRFYQPTSKRVRDDITMSYDWAALYAEIEGADKRLRDETTLTSTLLADQDREASLSRASELLAAIKSQLEYMQDQAATSKASLATRQAHLQLEEKKYLASLTEKDQTIIQDFLQELYVADPDIELELLEQKKDNILDGAFNWILKTDQYKKFVSWEADQPCRMLWVRGPSGTGKTMLVMGIIKLLTRTPPSGTPQRTVAHFFCQGTNKLFNTRISVLRSLVWQLLKHQNHLICHLQRRFEYLQKPRFVDEERKYAALSRAFRDMLQDPNLMHCYLVVDALDECTKSVQLLIQIAGFVACTNKVKWLVSSRPEVYAEELDAKLSPFRVDIDSQVLKHPVQFYIDYKLEELKRVYKDADLKVLSEEINKRAENTFLWVWFVFQELNAKHEKSDRTKRHTDPLSVVLKFPRGLSEVYGRILTIIEEDNDEEDVDLCKHCLDAVNMAFEPLTTKEMAALLFITEDKMSDVIHGCGSFLSISQPDQTISFIHQSAKDYMVQKRKPGIDSGVWTHIDMARQSLQAMCRPRPDCMTLHRNMYGLSHFGPHEKQGLSKPLTSLRYACLQWLHHINTNSKEDLPDDVTALLLEFWSQHYLHWIEATGLLSNMGRVLSLGMRFIMKRTQKLRQNTPRHDLPDLEFLIKLIDSVSPLQVYVQDRLLSQRRKSVQPGIEPFAEQGDPDGFQDLELERRPFRGTGKLGRRDRRWAATLSPENVGYIWDLETGEAVQVQADVPKLELLEISAEAQQYSVCQDNRIQLGSIATGAATVLLKGHAKSVFFCAFSADGRRFASGSKDGAIKVWDTHTGQCLATFDKDTPNPKCLALSMDGMRLAAYTSSWLLYNGDDSDNSHYNDDGDDSDHITVWDVDTGEHIRQFDTGSYVRQLCFSPDKKQLVIFSADTVRIWDLDTSEPGRRYWGSDQLDVPAIENVFFSKSGDALNILDHFSVGLVLEVATDDRVSMPRLHPLLHEPVDSFAEFKAKKAAYDKAAHAFACTQADIHNGPKNWITLHGKCFYSVFDLRCVWMSPTGNSITILTDAEVIVITCKCMRCKERTAQ